MAAQARTIVRRIREVVVTVSWTDPSLSDIVENVVSYFALDDGCESHAGYTRMQPRRTRPAGPQAVHAGNISIKLTTDRDALSVPSGAELIDASREGLEFFRCADVLFVRLAGGVSRIDAGRREAVMSVSDVRGGHRAAVIYCLFINAIVPMLLRRGILALHAACVVNDAGEGLLIVGGSGTGKSSLALRLVEQGWAYLSDDSVLLFADAGVVHAQALRKDFCLNDDTLDRSPDAAYGRAAMRHIVDGRKLRVDLSMAFPARKAAICRPAAVLFPRITGMDLTSMSTVSPTHSMSEMLSQCGSLISLDPPRRLRKPEPPQSTNVADEAVSAACRHESPHRRRHGAGGGADAAGRSRPADDYLG